MSSNVADYDFNFPEELIAQTPATPKDSARLLVYDRKTDTVTHTVFSKILDFLPRDCDVLLNNTKVIKARLFGTKDSGGRIELLFQKPLTETTFLVNIRGKVKVGTDLVFDSSLRARVLELNEDGTRIVAFYRRGKELSFHDLLPELETIGHVPLPPYIKREDNEQDSSDYQPLFAAKVGAVAAPTASLHFTPELFKTLQKSHRVHYLTLHVGIGTFKPVETENIHDHPMHSEYYEIPEATREVIDSERKILAVGTTVTRTVEYYAREKKPTGECDLFLNPDNPPIRVDYLLTNFHLPKSTLVMLVAAFVGREKMLELYREAIKEHYRFFSYGDAMLIL
jgi:S-adenosylmethionine:tRNA ribosyltransferase-isomerase